MRKLFQVVCLLLSPWLSRGQGQLRIVNGMDAYPGRLPYQVALECNYEDFHESFVCGGTIIDKRWILTAAHCLSEPGLVLRNVTVIAGTIDKYNESVPGYVAITVDKKDTFMHEEFSRDTVANDIGLIRLPKALKLTRNIRVAILPRKRRRFVGSSAIISGWGHMANNQFPTVLQFAKVKIISNSICEKIWNKKHLSANEPDHKTIFRSFICTDSSKGLPCGGDSGGPLVLEDPSVTVVGVVSHGWTGCPTDVPDVYTRVSSFVDWIESHTGPLRRP